MKNSSELKAVVSLPNTVESAEKLLRFIQKCKNKAYPDFDAASVSHDEWVETSTYCIKQAVIPDQKYNILLRKCLAEMLKIDPKCLDVCVPTAAALAPDDWRAACAMLEVLAKSDSKGTRVINKLPNAFLESALNQLSIQNDRSGLVGRFLASALVNADVDVVYDLLKPYLATSTNSIMTYFVIPLLKGKKNASTFFAALFEKIQLPSDFSVQVRLLKAARGANLDVAELIYTSEATNQALKAYDPTCRLDALELLCSATRKLTAPIPASVIDLLANNMDSYLGMGEPRRRADAVASLTHLFERIGKQKETEFETKEKFARFVAALHSWCELSLRPGSPYRYQAMTMLILQSLHSFKLLQAQQFETPLIVCVGSAYNDIRESAISLLLATCSTKSSELTKKAFELVQNTRKSETGAQFLCFIGPEVKPAVFKLVNEILSELELNGVNSGIAEKTCLHGLLMALRLLKRDSKDEEECLEICLNTWKLCSPYSLQRPPKQVLDFCWKAVKEACELVAVLDFSNPALTHLIEPTLTQLASLLTNTTHWGSLAAVPTAFINVGKHSPELAVQLAKSPLQSILNGEEVKETTRRSAGLPMLMQAALNVNFDFEFVEFVLKLAESEEKEEVAVHGMNCIKGILNNKDLTTKSKEFVEPALELALNRFNNKSWPIRNCAAMLLSTLLRRIFGPNNIPSPAPAFFHEFKNTYSILTSMLENADCFTDLQSIYPALALLTRLRPGGSKNKMLEQFEPQVIKLLASVNWQVRAMAAQALNSIASSKLNLALKLIQLMTLANQNQLHGLAVSAYLLLQSEPALLQTITESRELEHVKQLVLVNTCFETNVSLYCLYTLVCKERLIPFPKLLEFETRGLNPSVDVFEGLQAAISVDNADNLVEYSTHTAVLRSLPQNKWTPDLAKKVLQFDHPVDVHCQAFSINEFDECLVNTAVQYTLDPSQPLKVRHYALVYACKMTADLPPSIPDLILEFSRSDDVESRRSAVESILQVSNKRGIKDMQLNYSLFRLLSDDDEKCRETAVRAVSDTMLSEFECEKIVASQLSSQFLSSEILNEALASVNTALTNFKSSNLFLIERDGQYRDELRLLHLLELKCRKAEIPSTLRPSIEASLMTLKSQLNGLDFTQPFGAGGDADLVLLKTQTDTVASFLTE